MQGIDILVHNLSHSDLILGVKDQHSKSDVVARPKFNKFHAVSQLLFEELKSTLSGTNLTTFPLLDRSLSGNEKHIPVGYELQKAQSYSVNNLRFREDEKRFVDNEDKSSK